MGGWGWGDYYDYDHDYELFSFNIATLKILNIESPMTKLIARNYFHS